MKLEHENWIQIPCAPKYEINKRGDVRNIQTGQFLTVVSPKSRPNEPRVQLRIDGRRHARCFYQSALLWLTHGTIPKGKTHSRIVVPVIVSHGNERHFFDSCSQAAKFIAEREYYAASTVGHHLSKRRKEIFGWRINYQR